MGLGDQISSLYPNSNVEMTKVVDIFRLLIVKLTPFGRVAPTGEHLSHAVLPDFSAVIVCRGAIGGQGWTNLIFIAYNMCFLVKSI